MAVNTTSEDDGGEFDAAMDDPLYQLQAAMAQLYLVGGYGLEKDPSYAGMLPGFTCSVSSFIIIIIVVFFVIPLLL